MGDDMRAGPGTRRDDETADPQDMTRAPESPDPKPGTKSFRRRYDELEQRRVALVERLRALDTKGRAHPAYDRAMTLLTTTFRRASLAQRAAVLQSATWLIDVLDKWTSLV